MLFYIPRAQLAPERLPGYKQTDTVFFRLSMRTRVLLLISTHVAVSYLRSIN